MLVLATRFGWKTGQTDGDMLTAIGSSIRPSGSPHLLGVADRFPQSERLERVGQDPSLYVSKRTGSPGPGSGVDGGGKTPIDPKTNLEEPEDKGCSGSPGTPLVRRRHWVQGVRDTPRLEIC